MSSNEQQDSTESPYATNNRVDTLAPDVGTLKSQLAEVLQHLSAGTPAATPVAATAAPIPPVGDRLSAPDLPEEVYKLGQLQFSVPAPTTTAVSETLATRSAYGESGKLNLYPKPKNLPPFPSKCFIPEDEGLFSLVRSSEICNGWESEVLWNIVHATENALACSHKLAEALAAKDISAATDSFAVLNHFLYASYERINERIDFFTDALVSGKSEAFLLQKYLRGDDQPYQSSLYRATKSKFAELRSHAYAKEFKKQSAASSSSRLGNNNNNNHNNRGGPSASSSGHKDNK